MVIQFAKAKIFVCYTGVYSVRCVALTARMEDMTGEISHLRSLGRHHSLLFQQTHNQSWFSCFLIQGQKLLRQIWSQSVAAMAILSNCTGLYSMILVHAWCLSHHRSRSSSRVCGEGWYRPQMVFRLRIIQYPMALESEFQILSFIDQRMNQ